MEEESGKVRSIRAEILGVMTPVSILSDMLQTKHCYEVINEYLEYFANLILIPKDLYKIAKSINSSFSENEIKIIEKLLDTAFREFAQIIVKGNFFIGMGLEQIYQELEKDNKKWFLKKFNDSHYEQFNGFVRAWDDLYKNTLEPVCFSDEMDYLEKKMPMEFDNLIHESKEKERLKNLNNISEYETSRVSGSLSLVTAQIKLIEEHKINGFNVEREILQMRRQVLELESQENKAMVQDLLKTLDNL